jgi:hypothetical protein
MTPELARDLWASLAEHGRPEAEVARASETIPVYTVGIEPWIERLCLTYLRDLSTRNSHFKLVVAPYGGGKTHFLLSVGRRAREENFAVAYVPCRPGVSLATSLDLFREIINAIILPSEGGPGLVPLLRRVIANKRAQIHEANPPDPQGAFDAWIGSVLEEAHPEVTFGRVVAEALRALDNPASAAAGDAALRWLRGEIDSLTKEDLALLRLGKLSKARQNEFGRNLLWSVLRFVKEAGVHGTVLLIDEVETVFDVRGKALQRVLGAMRILIDQPAAIPGGVPLLCVCAAVPEILEQTKKYQALDQRIRVVGAAYEEGADRAPQIDLGKLGDERDLLLRLGEKLVGVGDLALGWQFDRKIQNENLQRLAKIAIEYSLEISARRIFVRSWVNILDLQHHRGERVLTEDELRSRYRGDFDALRATERPEENP